jgi:hypothetical protein
MALWPSTQGNHSIQPLRSPRQGRPDQFGLMGMASSSPTIENILIKHGTGARHNRPSQLEQGTASEVLDLRVEQEH